MLATKRNKCQPVEILIWINVCAFFCLQNVFIYFSTKTMKTNWVFIIQYKLELQLKWRFASFFSSVSLFVLVFCSFCLTLNSLIVAFVLHSNQAANTCCIALSCSLLFDCSAQLVKLLIADNRFRRLTETNDTHTHKQVHFFSLFVQPLLPLFCVVKCSSWVYFNAK